MPSQSRPRTHHKVAAVHTGVIHAGPQQCHHLHRLSKSLICPALRQHSDSLCHRDCLYTLHGQPLCSSMLQAVCMPAEQQRRSRVCSSSWALLRACTAGSRSSSTCCSHSCASRQACVALASLQRHAAGCASLRSLCRRRYVSHANGRTLCDGSARSDASSSQELAHYAIRPCECRAARGVEGAHLRLPLRQPWRRWQQQAALQARLQHRAHGSRCQGRHGARFSPDLCACRWAQT